MNMLRKEEVNTGRQEELDLVKGFLMFMIIVIHSFQLLADASAGKSAVYRIIFSAFMFTGATLYLFAMGFGSAYSKRNTPRDLFKNGWRLLFFQLLSNVCYVSCFFVGFQLHNLLFGEAAGSRDVYMSMISSMIRFLNIFFIAGMGYLVLALLRVIHMPLWGYVISAILVAVLSPVGAKLTTESYWINVILDAVFGGMGLASFPFFPYLSFVFLGYVFGKILRLVQPEQKERFYLEVGGLGGLIAVGWVVSVWISTGDLAGFYEVIHGLYHIPDLTKLIGSIAWILFVFWISFSILPWVKKCSAIYRKLLAISKHTSKYYAVHIGVYAFFAAVTAFRGFDTISCLLWSVAAMIITDIIVEVFVKYAKIRGRRSEGNGRGDSEKNGTINQ